MRFRLLETGIANGEAAGMRRTDVRNGDYPDGRNQDIDGRASRRRLAWRLAGRGARGLMVFARRRSPAARTFMSQADPRSAPTDEPAHVGGDASSTARHVARVREGDREGFEALYLRIAPSIYAWSCVRIHASLKGKLDPEDVVQEVWWRAMDSFDSFDAAKGSFRTWIFRIAKHVLLNGFRRLRVRSEIPGDLRNRRLEALPPNLASQSTSIGSRAARAEETKALLDEVASLSVDDRALFVHCALEGLSAPKAAALVGVSPDAAAKRWFRLREKLRDRLAAAGVIVDEPPKD
jgi:RNA polymerase sigma factor (sigma-70 family)